MVDVTIILGPNLHTIETSGGTPTGFINGSADFLFSQSAVQSQIINLGQKDFNDDSEGNPDGHTCNLDIDWVVSSYAHPLTLSLLQSKLKGVGASGGTVIFSGHGYIPQGTTETKTPLVTSTRTSGGIYTAKEKGYTWTDILTGASGDAKDLEDLSDINFFCCYASGLPDRVGNFRLIKATPTQFQGGTVVMPQYQTAFRNLIRGLCCKKYYGAGLPTEQK
jgi:hypothetical protein